MSGFEGKVALVTGGSRGIGRACCLELASRGAAVAFTWHQGEAAAQETARLLSEVGRAPARAFRLDAGDPKACAALPGEVVAALGRLDVLVNNAAVHVDALALRVKLEDWDRQFAVNVSGAFQLCKAAAKPMHKHGGGTVVNVASVVGERGNPGQVAYSASKAALVGMTKTLARELAGWNIRVNAVSPGLVDTDMLAQMPAAARERWLAEIPLARAGRPEEIARAVAFLAGEDSSYVTGEVLRVNGGLLT